MALAAENKNDVGFENIADELEPGTRLLHGQFTIDSFLNAGGFGITYLARDSLDRRVVIKECFPSSYCRRSGTRVAPRTRQRQDEFQSVVQLFLQEAFTLSRLDHPNIVKVHQVFEDNETAYMAMDYIQGPDLLDTVEGKADPLTPEQIVGVMGQMLDAVAYVHAQGVLHRDISPDNILLDLATGTPVLIDFGASRKDVTRKSRALSGLRVVKDGYSPQEFYISGSSQAPCSDLYALAATFSHLITREPPKTSQERLTAIAGRQSDPHRPLAGRIKGYPIGFLKAIDKAMGIFPRDRVQSVAEWQAILRGMPVGDTGYGPSFGGPQPAFGGPASGYGGPAPAYGGASPAYAAPTPAFAGSRPLTISVPAPTFLPANPVDEAEVEAAVTAIVLAAAAATSAEQAPIAQPPKAAVPVKAAVVAPEKAFESVSAEARVVEPAPAAVSTPAKSAAATPLPDLKAAVPVAQPRGSRDLLMSSAAAMLLLVGLLSLPGDLAQRFWPGQERAAEAAGPAVTVDIANENGLSRNVRLPFVADAADPGRVLARLPWSPSWVEPGLRIVEINGAPVQDGASLAAMASGDADLSKAAELNVIFGYVAASGADVIRKMETLPVVDRLELGNGLAFEMVRTPTGIQTVVAGLPEGVTSDLQVGDVLLVYSSTGETLGTETALADILGREMSKKVATYGFAVQREGSMATGSFQLPGLG